MSNNAFDALLKSILDQHRECGVMTIDLSNDSGVSLLRGYLASAHSLGMHVGVRIAKDARPKNIDQ
ncbi:hypothetical protein ACFQ5D_09310 [Paenibacillus farraposensis]|uniref:Uncharacterized protein n=1 Tax=Paenibacillus farraposensis TaxID=2807095 RepID=A0ABW4DCW2_9BACL|nr:hypothetical protein [Paenibacillus farraposensis]MCC3379883.1 hypothetical protein [Paenibacillus farraposensis]